MLRNFFAAFDLRILPIRNERCGNLTVEAMARHVPVAEIHGFRARDILKNPCTGILVSLNDEPGAAEAASRLLIDADFRRTVAAAGRTLAVCRYSKARWLEEIAEYYDEILTKIGTRQCA